MKTKPFLKSMALVICCLTSFVLVSCDKDDDKPNLKISPNKVEVAVGKTVTVSVMVLHHIRRNQVMQKSQLRNQIKMRL